MAQAGFHHYWLLVDSFFDCNFKVTVIDYDSDPYN